MPDESPIHEVELKPFLLGRSAVTNREFRAFLAVTGRVAPPAWTDERFTHPDQPVVSVSWFDAVDYCAWLAASSGAALRLPTEAERELACRGGTTSSYPWGDSPSRELGSYGRRWLEGAPEIAGGPPNGFGLLNMADNVHEWCADWHATDYYSVSPRRDPHGPASGTRRASRGGSWRHHVKVTRSSARSSLDPGLLYNDYGFRIAASG